MFHPAESVAYSLFSPVFVVCETSEFIKGCRLVRGLKRSNQCTKRSLQCGKILVGISTRTWNGGFTAFRIKLNNRWAWGMARKMKMPEPWAMWAELVEYPWQPCKQQPHGNDTLNKHTCHILTMIRGRGGLGGKLYKYSPAAKNTWNEVASETGL